MLPGSSGVGLRLRRIGLAATSAVTPTLGARGKLAPVLRAPPIGWLAPLRGRTAHLPPSMWGVPNERQVFAGAEPRSLLEVDLIARERQGVLADGIRASREGRRRELTV